VQTLSSEALTLSPHRAFSKYSFTLLEKKGGRHMKTRLVAFASTIVAVFYTAGAAWKL
jgi:hypothetical protein